MPFVKLLNHIISQSVIPQLVLDSDGKCILLNEDAKKLAQQFTAEDHLDNLFKSNWLRFMGWTEAVQQTLIDGKTRDCGGVGFTTSDKYEAQMRMRVFRIEIGEIYFLIMQVTDHRELYRLQNALQGSQIDLQEQQKILLASERRFEIAMEAAEEGIWDWEIVSGKVYYSPGYAIMLGYEPAKFRKHVEAWTDLLHPDDREVTLATSQRLLLTDDICTLEFRMRHADGRYRWILSNGKVIERTADGSAMRAIGTHLDITQRKEDEIKLQSARVEAQAAKDSAVKLLEDQQQFLRMFAHEMRNPLAVIDMATHVLEANVGNGDPNRKVLGRIRRGLERANAFVQQCLSEDQLLRLRTQGLAFNTEHISLRKLCESALDQVKKTNPGYSIASEIPNCRIMGDPLLLKILLLNLLDNSIKYSKEHSQILLNARIGANRQVILQVHDTGIGIPSEDLKRLGRRYVRGMNVSKISGMGLGLHLVHSIVEVHNGNLQIESVLGRGTTVTVELPGPTTEISSALPNKIKSRTRKTRLG